MARHWTNIWALLCLILSLQVVVAQNFAQVRRQDGGPPPTPAPSPSPASSGAPGQPNTAPPNPTVTSSVNGSSNSGASATVSATPSIISSNGTFTNSSIFNTTIPEGELPIPPRVTPGWAVSGVILLLTGAGYALIGIKNAWVHTFFSTAYLASLGTTVLIIYVMSVPISDTIQGAYVVAVAMTGIVLGAAATVFKEITEGLGCLLGGFCLSMWLLCLSPGGLLQATASKVIFIACFTLAAFGFYFSRFTRDYALIAMISFAGATVTVLGIDCFSRAGLKEFWAYVWDLNDNLFPLGADTYPVTKGIRVETAAIVIIFLAGLVSQLKLWRLIKERRSKRAAERLEGQRSLEEEEENVGRQVEEANTRERRRWERTYGDGGDTRSVDGGCGDSGVGDMESEKRLRRSDGVVSVVPQSPMESVIEMAEMSSPEMAPEVPPKSPTPGLMISEQNNDGTVMVRVARDDAPANGAAVDEDEQKVWILGPDGEVRPANQARAVKRSSRSMAASPEPAVVPLPFRVPTVQEPARRAADDERSSVATFADEADDDQRSVDALRKPHSFAKRLSQGSANLLRSLSQRSASDIRGIEHGDSREELVMPRTPRADEDDASIAAAVDFESVDGDRSTVRDGDGRRSMEITADFSKKAGKDKTVALDEPESHAERRTSKLMGLGLVSAAETVEADIQAAPEASQPPSPTKTRTEATFEDDDRELDDITRPAKSTASATSTPVSLTKDRLPKALSKIAMSYRTNEWAKHLSHAETPEPDTLRINEYPQEASTPKQAEAPVPLNVDELKQTAETGVPPPAITRTATAASTSTTTPRAVSRSNSRQSVVAGQPPTHLPIPAHQEANDRDSPVGNSPVATPGLQPASSYVNRSSSGGVRRASSRLHAPPIAEEGDRYHSASTTPIPEEESSSGFSSVSASPTPDMFMRPPIPPGIVSYSSPQTLLGQREVLLRNRSQGSLPGPMMAGPSDVYGGTPPPRAPSVAGSLYDYPAAAYGGGLAVVVPTVPDDDMPMSQRRELMRQNSLLAAGSSTSLASRPASGMATYQTLTADTLPFDSHQPQRGSHLPPPAVRQAQLASFRQSVAADLRAGTPVMSGGGNGRETPLGGGLVGASSTSLLPGGYGLGAGAAGSSLAVGRERESEVQRNIEDRRNALLSQKEAEARQREAERLEKERGERAMDERMRRGDLHQAHREAMKRLQGGVKR